MGQAVSRRHFLRVAAAATAAVAVGGTATACGSDGADAPEPAKARERPGGRDRTLRVALVNHFVPGYDTWFDSEFAPRWGERHDIDVIVDHIPLAELVVRASTEVSTRSGHDIFAFPSPPPSFEDDVIDHAEIVEEVASRVGSPIPLVERSCFNPRTKKWFGFPAYWSPNLVHYRTDLWASVGRPDGPGSWEDLRAMAGELRATGHPVGLGFAEEFDSNMALYSLLHSYGAAVQDGGANVALDSPATVQAVRMGTSIFRAGMSAEVFSWEASSNNRLLVSGRGSLILNPVSGLRACEKQDPDLAARVALAPPLAGPAGRATHSFLGVSVIWRFAEHPDLARRFLIDHALSSRDSLLHSEFYNLPGFPGAVPNLDQLVANDPTARPTDKYALLAEGREWSINLGHPGTANAAMDEVFNASLVPKMFAAAARGERSPEDAVAEAAAQVAAIFERWRDQGKI